MKSKIILKIIFLSISLLMFTGCSQISFVPVLKMPSDHLPVLDVPANQMNTKFIIWIPNGFGNTFRNNKTMKFMVKVIANDPIAFTMNHNVRIFIFQDEQWIELQNLMSYSGGLTDYNVILPSSKENDFINKSEVDFVPYKSDLKNEDTIRIFFTGFMVRNGKVTDEKATSYIDVPLKP